MKDKKKEDEAGAELPLAKARKKEYVSKKIHIKT